ncbi:hypothetical protein P154DRAFT_619780 [Amniculicola lignicola CBS 123094]|uniref:Protein kinase domain-containing protein n=1 Tax=Amniculicola lignicola CBS 123094 TaxID=1392246 RepID=A0A6A5WL38_9PLEO|nr:hypothetical protein P154DRAFT_619780 [Amniculicola lignicola CBS 123094]
MEPSSPNTPTSGTHSEASKSAKQELTPLQQNALHMVPPDYVPVSFAGNGVYATVFFCLPRSAIRTPSPSPPSSQTSSSSTTPLLSPSCSTKPSGPHPNLRNHLVAIKIPHPSWSPAAQTLTTEIQHHRRISSTLNAYSSISPLQSRFLQILAYAQSSGPSSSTWFTLPAIYPSLTLSHLYCAFIDWSKPRSRAKLDITRVPRAWTAHVFLQLGDAVRFLHGAVGIVHGDFHAGNVMVDTTRGTGIGMGTERGWPELVVIDFGRADSIRVGEGTGIGMAMDENEAKRRVRQEVLSLCSILHEWKSTDVPRKNDESTPEEEWRDALWREFEDVVQAINLGEGELGLDELWSRFGGVAEAVRNSAGADDMEIVESMVRKAVEEEVEEVVVDEALWKALKGADKTV